MFYSHEILTSTQHGVATIWLVATVGPRGGTRKVTRKAIQEVNVRKACKTILEPGAPMALRLQGNLLYGVSRVFAQQCNYVLNDAERVQVEMRAFYDLISQDKTDPDAGKARREQNMIEDDPKFILSPNLPHFDFGVDANFLFPQPQSQVSSMKDFSQLSPVDMSHSLRERDSSIMGFNLSQSDGNSFSIASPFQVPTSAQKQNLGPEDLNEAGDKDHIGVLGDLELDIDAEGNVLGILDPFDEPELPQLPAMQAQVALLASSPAHHKARRSQTQADEEGDILMMEDEPQPNAVDLPQAQQMAVSAKRGRKIKALPQDNSTKVPDTDIRAWIRDYVEINEGARLRGYKPTTTQARQFAYNITLGQGVGGIGQLFDLQGFVHPLAHIFAGNALGERVFGIRPALDDGSLRRSSSEAFNDEEDGEQGRRVRRRLNQETPQPGQGRPEEDLGHPFTGDALPPEMGMGDRRPMDDRMSSSLMPWNRTPSVRPPPSVVDQGSRQRAGSHMLTISPKGSNIDPVERHSDAATGSHFGSDLGFGPLHSMNSSRLDLGLEVPADQEETQDSQWMQSALDIASNEFLDYAKTQVLEKGTARSDHSDTGRLWISFEALAIPGVHSKAVAAQAFLHALTLGTRNLIGITQSTEDNQAFATIRLGISVDMDLEDDIAMFED